MIERGHSLPVTHQCELLALSRSSVYHQPAPVSEQDLEAMRLLDEAHLQLPFYGSRRLSDWLGERVVKANRKRVRRVMRLMGLEALYPRPRTSRAGRGHKVYLYLLRELTVERPNQVWAADICSLPMARGFLYLVAVMDWYSRKVLAWRLSNTLNGDVVLDHHHRVALLAERAQGVEQHRVVAGVQPDGRLVEDVAHAAQVRAELRGEPDALRLATREGGRGAVEPQVSEADLAEEVEPGHEFREHVAGDRRLAPARPDPRQDAARGPDVEGAEVRDAARAVAHCQRLRAQPPAGAGAALARRLVVPAL